MGQNLAKYDGEGRDVGIGLYGVNIGLSRLVERAVGILCGIISVHMT